MKRREFLTNSLVAFSTLGLCGAYWEQRWHYIVIHHSAGDYGCIPFLTKVHRRRNYSDPIDAIPYHYIIGNGNGLGMGEIASDWRQTYDIWGAHVSKKNPEINFRGIGICLIGNFEIDFVPAKQYMALVKLTRYLMTRYLISPKNVTGHGYIPGEATKCPGKHFPMKRFIRDIT